MEDGNALWEGVCAPRVDFDNHGGGRGRQVLPGAERIDRVRYFL